MTRKWIVLATGLGALALTMLFYTTAGSRRRPQAANEDELRIENWEGEGGGPRTD